VCIDPKLRNLAAHQPSTVITPNTQEAERASGIAISNTRELVRASKKIINLTRARYLLVTRGEKGMALFEGDSRGTHMRWRWCRVCQSWKRPWCRILRPVS
jgi:bifunctional ADP-heptose synthase (sugar kinase/adenylyltransferase)